MFSVCFGVQGLEASGWAQVSGFRVTIGTLIELNRISFPVAFGLETCAVSRLGLSESTQHSPYPPQCSDPDALAKGSNLGHFMTSLQISVSTSASKSTQSWKGRENGTGVTA